MNENDQPHVVTFPTRRQTVTLFFLNLLVFGTVLGLIYGLIQLTLWLFGPELCLALVMLAVLRLAWAYRDFFRQDRAGTKEFQASRKATAPGAPPP